MSCSESTVELFTLDACVDSEAVARKSVIKKHASNARPHTVSRTFEFLRFDRNCDASENKIDHLSFTPTFRRGPVHPNETRTISMVLLASR